MMENVVMIDIIIKKNILRLLGKTGLESEFSDPVFFILLKIWIYFKSLHNLKKLFQVVQNMNKNIKKFDKNQFYTKPCLNNKFITNFPNKEYKPIIFK